MKTQKTIAQLKEQLAKYKADRDELYAEVQDMSVSANRTDQVMKSLAEHKNWIEATEKEIASRTKSECVADFIERKKQWETE